LPTVTCHRPKETSTRCVSWWCFPHKVVQSVWTRFSRLVCASCCKAQLCHQPVLIDSMHLSSTTRAASSYVPCVVCDVQHSSVCHTCTAVLVAVLVLLPSESKHPHLPELPHMPAHPPFSCLQLLFNANAIKCNPQYWQDPATRGTPQTG
jgi:hypothetical protein